MCLNDVDPKIFDELTPDHIKQIGDYLQDSQTATWFREDAAKKTPPPGLGKIITTEVIYYWMVTLQIDFEAQD